MTGGQTLYYNPINEEPAEHPASARDHKARAINKRGRDSEKRVKAALQKQIVRSTIASGAKLQDGDLEIHGLQEDISIECKDRGRIKRWFVTREEYEHGRRNGIEAFAITRTDPDTNQSETMMFITAELFSRLVGRELSTEELTKTKTNED